MGSEFLVWAMQAYQEIEQRLVSETVFSQYMYKTLPSCNHLWAFKKQFCCQMALSGILDAKNVTVAQVHTYQSIVSQPPRLIDLIASPAHQTSSGEGACHQHSNC